MIKKLTSYLAIAALVCVSLASCKKDKKSTEELILGKWFLNSYEWKYVENGEVDEGIDDWSSLGWYLEFKSDNSVIIKYGGGDPTVGSYSVLSSNKIAINGEETLLSKIDETHLSLYSKETVGNDTYEDWYHFTK